MAERTKEENADRLSALAEIAEATRGASAEQRVEGAVRVAEGLAAECAYLRAECERLRVIVDAAVDCFKTAPDTPEGCRAESVLFGLVKAEVERRA